MINPPYPYFGGKSAISNDVQSRLGNYQNFCDPFFGGGSSLWFDRRWNWDKLNWNEKAPIETVNDLFGHVANFWRATQADPRAVAEAADRPVNENDLHSIHFYLNNETQRLAARLEANPDYYDAKLAGWWVWGMACWIGGEFCGGGPWVEVEGELVKGNAGRGVKRQLPHLGSAGQGVNRQLPHLGDAGQGVNQEKPYTPNPSTQAEDWHNWLIEYMTALQSRLRRVRVCCGDWRRVLGPTPTIGNGLTAVWFDPPYIDAERADVYTLDSRTVAADVWAWCAENGDNPKFRIALCGYDGDYEALPGWDVWRWKARGGYANQGKEENDNRSKEVVLFSPHCVKVDKYEQVGF